MSAAGASVSDTGGAAVDAPGEVTVVGGAAGGAVVVDDVVAAAVVEVVEVVVDPVPEAFMKITVIQSRFSDSRTAPIPT